MKHFLFLILMLCLIPRFASAQTVKEWQLSVGLLPIEQVFAKAIIDEVKPADPYQPDGFLPIGNFIASCNFTQNRFSFMIESFSGFMKIRSKEVASQQIYSTNCLNSGLLFGGRYCWTSGKMKIYSGASVGGQLLFSWNQNDESLISKIPAFHLDAIGFRFGERIKWNVGIGFGSKGIVNIGVALP